MKTGIDISSHQGAVNWGKVVADFAILRAGWSWYDGGMNIDKRFLQNVAGAREVGVPWGAYLYAYDRTPAAARVSAERLADLLDQFQLPYPVAYDFEDTQYLGTGRESNTAICKAFLETLQGRGYYVMLYTYTNFAKGYLDMARLAAYDLWIADYTGQVGWPGEYGIWQYSGSGRAPGVAGQVDLDRAYRDYPAIIRAAGTPIAAPSGNTSGKPSPTTAQHMLDDMEGKIDAVLDGGSCQVGVESTVVDLTCQPPRLLRPGGVPLEELRDVLKEIELDPAVTRPMKEGETPRAPGMKYRHYAPKAPVTVVKGEPAHSAQYILDHISDSYWEGVICFNEFSHWFENHPVEALGGALDSFEHARRLFRALRAMDASGVKHIWAQCPDSAGMGLAVVNRLNKAAGFRVVDA